MSDMVIKDGTGSGKRVQVNSSNQLVTNAVVSTDYHYNSDALGRAYSTIINEVTLSNTANDYTVMLYKNLDPSLQFHINKIYVSWNGGSTNHNRVVTTRFKLGGIEPTANASIFTPLNNNTRFANNALADAFIWNGVGNGMTIATTGSLVYSAYFPQGMKMVDFEGAFILSFNTTISISMQPEEAGNAGFIMSGYYDEIDL
jgi:hypothetical protein